MSTVLFTATLLGCVSKKKYTALESAHQAGTVEAEQLANRIKLLEHELEGARTDNAGLTDQVGNLTKEKAGLLKDQSKLEASIEEMNTALVQLNKRKAMSDARLARYRDLLSRFQQLIDAGKLEVKIVDGRMVVALATDVLFDSGSAKLSEEGNTAITEVSQVLASIPDRAFQVEGHTDNVPISTAQYPSNWHLAAGRALTVVETMIAEGMPAERISAASLAETRPVGPNDTDEGKATNRRIEIVVVPDLSVLPGFDELKAAAAQ